MRGVLFRQEVVLEKDGLSTQCWSALCHRWIPHKAYMVKEEYTKTPMSDIRITSRRHVAKNEISVLRSHINYVSIANNRLVIKYNRCCTRLARRYNIQTPMVIEHVPCEVPPSLLLAAGCCQQKQETVTSNWNETPFQINSGGICWGTYRCVDWSLEDGERSG